MKKWKLIKEEDVSPSKWFQLFKHTVELPNGKIVDDYYISKLGDVAMILAITKNREVVFVKQYKHGAGDIILELPAGRVGNKTPIEGAKAELEEETGFVSNNFKLLGTLSISPSKDTSKVYGFLVTDIDIQSEQKLDDNEEIEIVLIPVNDVENKINSGEIYAPDTIAFLYIAKLKYPEVFE